MDLVVRKVIIRWAKFKLQEHWFLVIYTLHSKSNCKSTQITYLTARAVRTARPVQIPTHKPARTLSGMDRAAEKDRSLWFSWGRRQSGAARSLPRSSGSLFYIFLVSHCQLLFSFFKLQNYISRLLLLKILTELDSDFKH